MINLWTIAPLYLGGMPPSTAGSRVYRAMLINVNAHAGNPPKVAQAIKAIDPDVLLLEEVSESWLSDLSQALRSFAYSRVMPRDDNFGMALYSKLPIVHSDTHRPLPPYGGHRHSEKSQRAQSWLGSLSGGGRFREDRNRSALRLSCLAARRSGAPVRRTRGRQFSLSWGRAGCRLLV